MNTEKLNKSCSCMEQHNLINKTLNFSLRDCWGCQVCGLDSWCGTDGCPLDPQ